MPGGVHEFMKAWEPEEDQIIMEMLERLGPKWSKIVQRLPGRTVSSVRNRWQRIDKGRRLREAGHESKNRCQQCGKPKRGHVCMARLKNRGESGELAAIALKQWETANHVVTGVAAEGGEGLLLLGHSGGEGVVQVHLGVPQMPHVSRSSSAPACLQGNANSPGGRDYDRGQASMDNAALLSQLSSGQNMGFDALAAAAEAELKRTNSCDIQRTTSCCSLGAGSMAGSNLSSSTVHTVLLSFGTSPNIKREGDSQGSSTSDISSTPSVSEEADLAKLKAAAEHNQRLADLVAADQRIFGGGGCDEDEVARIEAEAEAALLA